MKSTEMERQHPHRLEYIEYRYDGAIPPEFRDTLSRHRGIFQCCAAIRRRRRIYDRVTRELDEMTAGHADRARVDYCWREIAACRRALIALHHRLAYFLSLETNG